MQAYEFKINNGGPHAEGVLLTHEDQEQARESLKLRFLSKNIEVEPLKVPETKPCT